MSRLRAPSLSRLAVATTALTAALTVLGVWTAVGGYGLTCAGRWPFCDGAVFGLFPANFGSFVEWFHRLVAMVTGFAILGTTVLAWHRNAARGVRAAFTAALVVTPVQVVLGALTVTEYELAILAAHFGAALVILTLLVAGTARLVDALPARTRLGVVAAAALAGTVVLSPGLVLSHSIPVHLAYYSLGLLGYVALLLAGTAPPEAADAADRAPRLLAAVGAAAAALGLVIGRIAYDPTGQAIGLGALATAVALAAGLAWLARRDGSSRVARRVGGDLQR